jgi:hypothetical protein
MSNVILPEEFVATKYPGYFWNTKVRALFTAKLGVLRRLPITKPNHFNKLKEPAYRISNKGKRGVLTLTYLEALVPTASVFPVFFETTKNGTNDDVAVNLGKLPAGTKVRVYIEG